MNQAPSSNFGCTGTINNMLITWKCKKTSYGLISHVACTYSYFLRYWKPNSVRCLPSFLPRNFCCPYFRSWRMGGGGLTLGAGVHRAICMFYMDSAAQLRSPVYIHPEPKMDSFF